MNQRKEKSYIVTEIEFDYDDGNNMESYPISYDEPVSYTHLTLPTIVGG